MAIGTAGTTLYPFVGDINSSITELRLRFPTTRSEDIVTETEVLGDIPEEEIEKLKGDTPDIPPNYQDVWRRYTVLDAAVAASLTQYSSFKDQLKDIRLLIVSQGALNKTALSLRDRLVVVLSKHDKTEILGIQAEVNKFDEDNHLSFDFPTQGIVKDILDQIGEELGHQPASV